MAASKSALYAATACEEARRGFWRTTRSTLWSNRSRHRTKRSI